MRIYSVTYTNRWHSESDLVYVGTDREKALSYDPVGDEKYYVDIEVWIDGELIQSDCVRKKLK